MSEHGHELAVDKVRLYKVGRYDLPQVAAQFDTAWGHLPEYPGNFYRSGGLGAGDPTEGAAPAWAKLAKALNDVLWATRQNLVDTGEALCTQAVDYMKTDANAQAEFDSTIKQLGTVH